MFVGCALSWILLECDIDVIFTLLVTLQPGTSGFDAAMEAVAEEIAAAEPVAET